MTTIACGSVPGFWWMYQPDIHLCSHDWNHFVGLFIMGTCNDR